MADKPEKKKELTIGKVVLIILIAVFVFIMFPRRQSILDGGTVYYESWPLGIVYSVENLHEFVRENNDNYFRKGIRINIFNKAVYEDSYIDYEHPEPTGHSPEYYGRGAFLIASCSTTSTPDSAGGSHRQHVLPERQGKRTVVVSDKEL